MAAALLAGCASPHGTPPAAEDPPSGILIDFQATNDLSYEFDVMCALGGSDELKRIRGSQVASGSSEVRFALELPPTYTGFQYGYRVEPNESVTWLPTLRESGERLVAVGPGQHETPGEEKWHFYYRMNIDPEQDCYTGGGIGGLRILIEAR